jgi:hypothetical protein
MGMPGGGASLALKSGRGVVNCFVMLSEEHEGRPLWYRLFVSRRFIWARRTAWLGVFVVIALYGARALRRHDSPAVNSRHILTEREKPLPTEDQMAQEEAERAAK